MTIDLRPFCSTDPDRPYVHKPFTRGEWSYGTNGHIAVRVPKRDDVLYIKEAPHAERVFTADYAALTLRAFRGADVPAVDCKGCDGIGAAGHDCPTCQCDCLACNGTGFAPVSVNIAGVPFASKYVDLIQKLPDIRIPDTVRPAELMPFTFDGGQGVLMPLSDPHETHVDERAAHAGELAAEDQP